MLKIDLNYFSSNFWTLWVATEPWPDPAPPSPTDPSSSSWEVSSYSFSSLMVECHNQEHISAFYHENWFLPWTTSSESPSWDNSSSPSPSSCSSISLGRTIYAKNSAQNWNFLEISGDHFVKYVKPLQCHPFRPACTWSLNYFGQLWPNIGIFCGEGGERGGADFSLSSSETYNEK